MQPMQRRPTLRGVVKPTAKRFGVNGEDDVALAPAPKARLRGRAKALRQFAHPQYSLVLLLPYYLPLLLTPQSIGAQVNLNALN